MIKNIFLLLFARYNRNVQHAELTWKEIEQSYSKPSRHYHNLDHLEHMHSELVHVQTEINDWDTILFALFYHDIVYKPTSNRNEEKSAELAEARLIQLSFPPSQIEKCKQTILATKIHVESTDMDINYFTDADLCILGQNWETYSAYVQKIRKEYSIYPDFIYKLGRKKVLSSFLGMKRIFKTAFFFDRFEEKSKENLKRELVML